MTDPTGKLCAGETSAAPTDARRSAATLSPSSSTGIGTASTSEPWNGSRSGIQPGSSTPMRLIPRAASVLAKVPSACTAPLVMKVFSSETAAPRTRPR